MYKKLVSLLLSIFLVMSSLAVSAIDTYGGHPIYTDIMVNGHFIKCVQKPITVKGSVYIPLRAFSDVIGAEISWNHDDQAATVTKGNHTFAFYGEKDYSLIDGEKSTGAIMENHLLFVPVRVTCTALGYSVNWDSFNYIVEIAAPEIEVPENLKDYSYTHEDILYLAKITQIESGYQPFNTQVGVANTIINRVNSSLFPNTIKGVIFDTKYGTQFPPAHTDKINVTPSNASVLAAKCALNGVNTVGNSLYFISGKNASSSWAHKNRAFYATIGAMNFYL